MPDLWLELPSGLVSLALSHEPVFHDFNFHRPDVGFQEFAKPALAPLVEPTLDFRDPFAELQPRDWSDYAQLLVPRDILAPIEEKTKSCKKAPARKEERRPSLHKRVNSQLYKTELCVSYIKSGACPYGSKCQFAHGEDDLKSVERPANWRSKPCANWTKYGLCRYGKRCCFKHA